MIRKTLETRMHEEFLDVTGLVGTAVDEMGLVDGAVLVFNPHTTAGLTINEGADPDVVDDLLGIFAGLVPWRGNYRHAEGNAAAHAKASLMGSSVLVPVSQGRLQLGTWQKVWFCEFDGPRKRNLWVSVVGQSGTGGDFKGK